MTQASYTTSCFFIMYNISSLFTILTYVPNGSHPLQLLVRIAHSSLELQSGCRVLYTETSQWVISQLAS